MYSCDAGYVVGRLIRENCVYVWFQISRKAREHNMNIIFAVPLNKNTTYSVLSRSISGSSTGILKGNSENVIGLVSGEYEVPRSEYIACK